MAYHNPNNPDALPWFAEPEKKGGAKANANQAPPAQSYHQQPPPQPQNYRPQPQPQYQQQQQPPPRRQAEPQYRQDVRPLSPAMPPRDAYNGGRVGLPSGPRLGASSAPPPRSPLPPRSPAQPPVPPEPMRSPVVPPAPSVVFQGDQELTREQIRIIFEGLDVNRIGFITEKQLADNLVNSDKTRFNAYTVSMMMRMFDADRNGGLAFEEFVGLWQFLQKWCVLFNQFDVDHSGNISLSEFQTALVSFQYRLSDTFVKFIFDIYNQGASEITFDIFMQSCITLKRMTDIFKKYDDDRDGYITISFEEFVTEFLRQMQRMTLVEPRESKRHSGPIH